MSATELGLLRRLDKMQGADGGSITQSLAKRFLSTQRMRLSGLLLDRVNL